MRLNAVSKSLWTLPLCIFFQLNFCGCSNCWVICHYWKLPILCSSILNVSKPFWSISPSTLWSTYKMCTLSLCCGISLSEIYFWIAYFALFTLWFLKLIISSRTKSVNFYLTSTWYCCNFGDFINTFITVWAHFRRYSSRWLLMSYCKCLPGSCQFFFSNDLVARNFELPIWWLFLIDFRCWASNSKSTSWRTSSILIRSSPMILLTITSAVF